MSTAEPVMTFQPYDQEELIEFNGMTFTIQQQGIEFLNFSEQVTTRLELQRSNIMRYLDSCKDAGLGHTNKDGKIMFADDQFVVR